MASGYSAPVKLPALRIDVVDGVNTTTQTVTGIAEEDTILQVLHLSVKGTIATAADVTSHCTVSDDDEVTFDADYSSDQMIIFWHDGNCAPGEPQPGPAGKLRVDLVDGVAATTATLTGITENDVIISALHWTTKASIASLADVTAQITITDDDEITMGADYSNDLIMVFWWDCSGPDEPGYAAQRIRFDLITGHGTTQTVTGMTADDEILFAANLATAADIAAITDDTSNCTPAAGAVTFGSTTADDQEWIIWLDVND